MRGARRLGLFSALALSACNALLGLGGDSFDVPESASASVTSASGGGSVSATSASAGGAGGQGGTGTGVGGGGFGGSGGGASFGELVESGVTMFAADDFTIVAATGSGFVLAIDATGLNATRMFTVPVTAVAVHAGVAVWANSGDIFMLGLVAMAPSLLVTPTGVPSSIAFNDLEVYYTTSAGIRRITLNPIADYPLATGMGFQSVVADSSGALWSVPASRIVMQYDLMSVTVATSQLKKPIGKVAIDDAQMFVPVVDPQVGEIDTAPRFNVMAFPSPFIDVNDLRSIAVDATNLYFTTCNKKGSTVQRSPKTINGPMTLTTAFVCPSDIEVTSSWVYVLDASTKELRRFNK